MERVGVRHRYSGCDATNIVNILLYTMDMMQSYIADEISEIQLVSYHQYSGCDERDTVGVWSDRGCEVTECLCCHNTVCDALQWIYQKQRECGVRDTGIV